MHFKSLFKFLGSDNVRSSGACCCCCCCCCDSADTVGKVGLRRVSIVIGDGDVSAVVVLMDTDNEESENPNVYSFTIPSSLLIMSSLKS